MCGRVEIRTDSATLMRFLASTQGAGWRPSNFTVEPSRVRSTFSAWVERSPCALQSWRPECTGSGVTSITRRRLRYSLVTACEPTGAHHNVQA